MLTAIGLYGVLAYAVATRTKEIGIRMALGAPRPVVVRMVLGNGLRLVLAGGLLGLPVAYATAGLLSNALHGIRPHDPAVLGGSLGLLALVGAVAGVLPALRAATVNPITVLRSD